MGVLVHIPKKQVSAIQAISIKNQRDSLHFVSNHSQSTAPNYYTTSRNAFLFNPGGVYGSSNDLLFYTVNYAFTKNISVGLSSTPILLPAALNLRGNFQIGHEFYLGLTAIAGDLTYFDSKTYLLSGIITLTYGNERRNFSFFGGYGNFNNWILPRRNRRTGITTTGNYYVSRNSSFAGAAFLSIFPKLKGVYVTAEGMVYPEVNLLTASAAIRFNRHARISWDFGLQHFHNMNFVNGWSPFAHWDYFTIPYLGFAFSF